MRESCAKEDIMNLIDKVKHMELAKKENLKS